MLGLKLPTDTYWANIVLNNIQEALSDHAWCEQKAASNAITLITMYPEYTDLVDTMLSISKEELTHFEMVHQKIKERGWQLGRERADAYVKELYTFMKKGYSREIAFTDKLLFAAMVEARSCERFKVLSECAPDEELKKFYFDLMASEATHYTTFLNFARKYNHGMDVEARWKEWLEYEAQVIARYGKTETIHG